MSLINYFMMNYKMPEAIILLVGIIFMFSSCSEENNINPKEDLVYTTITDLNFEKALIALHIDTEKEENGKLLTSDAVKISSLNLSNKNISNLTGIRDFTNLTTLDVSINELVVLDISVLTKLTSLDVSANLMTHLDISQLDVLNTLTINENEELHCVKTIENQVIENVTKDEHQGLSHNNCEIESVYVTIPDVNFEQRLIELGIDSDSTVNQKILTEDALIVTSLDLFLDDNDVELKIKDLTGIEGFKNLIALSVKNNALTSISLSANTSLDTLILYDNRLTAIDLSSNTDLTYIDAGSNVLEEIDLSNNVNLEVVSLVNNNISKIDVSQNINLLELSLLVNELISINGLDATTKLVTLNLSWNLLEELVVNIPSLEGLNVEQNLLKNLDVSGSTSLTGLIAGVNSLQTLDVSHNVALETLILSANEIETINLDNNVNLELLWISSNQLTSLDVSKLSKVHDLSIGKNSDLSCIRIAAGQSIATVRKEEGQDLIENGCQETPEEYITLLDENFERLLVLHSYDTDGLINQKILKSDAEKILTLELSQSFSNPNDADKIRDLTGIEGFVNLETLNLEYNLLASIDLSQNLKLTTLNVKNNLLYSLDVSNNFALENLMISSNDIETINLDNNTNLRLLFVSYNQLNSLDVSKLSGLSELEVEGNLHLNCIKIAMGQAIGYVKKNPDQELSSNGCQETPEEYITILDENFERLLVLYLDDSDGLINQKILKSDAEKITTLELGQSTSANEADKIKDLTGIEGFINLEKLYLENNLLESIDLSNNLKINTLHVQYNLLTHLDVSSNVLLNNTDFSNNKLETIVLGDNTSYTNLFLFNNELKTLDVSRQTNLETLFVDHNNLESVQLSTSIAKLYLQNNLLASLDISGLSALNTLFVKENSGLNCIKISAGQNITTLSKNDHQEINTSCN